MPLQVSIDDTNTTLIQYEGTWEVLIGSSRQWESSVHGTIQQGASATFSFRGYQVWVWGTIPAGVGSSLVDFSVDGASPNTTSLASNDSAVYNEIFYESPLLRDTYHTIVVRNQGSSANGNTEFLLDRFQFETSDDVPVFTATGSASGTAAATSSGSPSSPTAATVSSNDSSGASKVPVGAIAGAVIGVLVVIVAVLVYLLWRRQKGAKRESLVVKPALPPHRSILEPVPFSLANEGIAGIQPTAAHRDSSMETSGENLGRPAVLSEKTRYGGQRRESRAIDPIPSGALSNEITSTTDSRPLAHSSSAGLTNDSSSEMHVPHSFQRSTHPLSDVASTVPEAFDNPPPSYWQENGS